MEGVTRHFYLRALIEERMGSQIDWNAVDSLMLKALAAAEKVARYRHVQLSAIRLACDINGPIEAGPALRFQRPLARFRSGGPFGYRPPAPAPWAATGASRLAALGFRAYVPSVNPRT